MQGRGAVPGRRLTDAPNGDGEEKASGGAPLLLNRDGARGYGRLDELGPREEEVLGWLGGARGRGRGPASVAAVALGKQRKRLPRAQLEDEDAGDPHGEAAAAWRLNEGWIGCSGSERRSSGSCWWVEENEEKGIPRWRGQGGWRRDGMGRMGQDP